MAYKVTKEYLNRWFDDGMKVIAMTDKTSQEDLEHIFNNQNMLLGAISCVLT